MDSHSPLGLSRRLRYLDSAVCFAFARLNSCTSPQAACSNYIALIGITGVARKQSAEFVGIPSPTDVIKRSLTAKRRSNNEVVARDRMLQLERPAG
eukprot:scaffold10860_cov182-Amphora_coffeaeformis.AAC.12